MLWAMSFASPGLGIRSQKSRRPVAREDRVSEVMDHEVDQHPRADAVDDGGVLDPPQKLMTKRERMKLGNFSGIPVRMRRMTEENITMCWKRKFRLNRRNVSPFLPRASPSSAPPSRDGPRPSGPRRSGPEGPARSLPARAGGFSRAAPRPVRGSPETCSFIAASISLPTASLVASFPVVLRHSRHSPIGHYVSAVGTHLPCIRVSRCVPLGECPPLCLRCP